METHHTAQGWPMKYCYESKKKKKKEKLWYKIQSICMFVHWHGKSPPSDIIYVRILSLDIMGSTNGSKLGPLTNGIRITKKQVMQHLRCFPSLLNKHLQDPAMYFNKISKCWCTSKFGKQFSTGKKQERFKNYIGKKRKNITANFHKGFNPQAPVNLSLLIRNGKHWLKRLLEQQVKLCMIPNLSTTKDATLSPLATQTGWLRLVGSGKDSAGSWWNGRRVSSESCCCGNQCFPFTIQEPSEAFMWKELARKIQDKWP